MARKLAVEFAKPDLLAGEVNRLRSALSELQQACDKSQSHECICPACRTLRGFRDGIKRVLKGP